MPWYRDCLYPATSMRSPRLSPAICRLLNGLTRNAAARHLTKKTPGRTAMLTLYQLEVFVAVARHLNITRAARALHVSQSAVSQQIDRLEENLRVTLIKKARRGIDLTEAGVSVRIESENILARVNALKKNYGRGISIMIFTLTASEGSVGSLLL
jgi:DNA-binding MarR family transcriptional regulator